MTREKYERDLALMRDMNVNMVRLHCHFANPELYDVADERGLLLWQDFLEAWYPHDRGFALRAAALYDPLVRMVRHHPSIALWATSDEEDLENYRVLTKHLAPRPLLLDPERRPVHRSTGRYGDAHVYEGWYGGTIWDYTRTEEAFISELGATALPNLESLLRFLPDHWPIAEHREDWVFRKLQIEEAMEAWGNPAGLGLEEYIPRTQSYVALLHQLAIERLRRRKYQAGGILHFHAIDFWPSVTMAALDYYRQPTASFHAVKRAFQLVLPSLEFDRDSWVPGRAGAGSGPSTTAGRRSRGRRSPGSGETPPGGPPQLASDPSTSRPTSPSSWRRWAGSRPGPAGTSSWSGSPPATASATRTATPSWSGRKRGAGPEP